MRDYLMMKNFGKLSSGCHPEAYHVAEQPEKAKLCG